MNDSVELDPSALPSPRALARATATAAAVAALLLVLVVLPAETGVDPTGVGEWLGLTALGEIKSGEAAAESSAYAFRADEMTLTLKPNEGLEVKAVMHAGDQLVYSWTADRGELFFDFHGEPKGAPADVFTSFEKGTKSASQGEFEAPFEGVHGWYWKNRTSEPIAVQLKTSGVYASIARK